jgi:DeoR family transcriptional regulator of aga operon
LSQSFFIVLLHFIIIYLIEISFIGTIQSIGTGCCGGKMMSKGEIRREWIMKQLRIKGSIQVNEIVEEFAVSEATVRRDLELLESDKKCIRTLGGAILESIKTEIPFYKKLEINAEEKNEIADKALSLIQEGDIIGLTGGSTNYLIAKKLQEFRNLTIVTNAINIAYECIGIPGLQLIVTGGVIRTQSFELSGPLADGTLEKIHIQKTFVGVDGISLQRGLTTFNELEAQTNRLMIQQSMQAYVVADHTKFSSSSLFVITDLKSITGVITNQALPASEVQAYQSAGIPFI